MEASKAHIQREKERAKLLRKTQWWQVKLQNPVCHYCGKAVARKDATMDHIVPLSRGGKSAKGNVVLACKACNNDKKSATPVEWLDLLKNEES